MLMNNGQVMGINWVIVRASRDAMVTKMYTTWTFIFSTKEKKKEKLYKLMFGAQKGRMDWDRDRVKIELKKQEAFLKRGLEKAWIF